jgi:hypothetical protein
VGQVEDRGNIDLEIAKQTILPHEYKLYVDKNPAKGIDDRRSRIASNHVKLKNIVAESECDLVFQVEGDSVLPENALERLLGQYIKLGDDVIVSGVEIGRHGLYCIGAWLFDGEDYFKSADYRWTGIRDVDAFGFYCLLTSKKTWLKGSASYNGEKWGPDVNWCLSINEKKYVDMDLKIGHRTPTGIIEVDQMSTCNAEFYMERGEWKFKQL